MIGVLDKLVSDVATLRNKATSVCPEEVTAVVQVAMLALRELKISKESLESEKERMRIAQHNAQRAANMMRLSEYRSMNANTAQTIGWQILAIKALLNAGYDG